MKLSFDEDAWADYLYWQETETRLVRRINELIRDCSRSHFKGLGKPEPLKGEFSGWWSRRIDDEHRMVYRVTGSGEAQALEIIQLRYHYSR